MHWGLRQGDPLSPFLFILAMKGLHLSIQKAVEDKRITGAFVGENKFNISHLFYAEDVVFLSKWNAREVDGILHVLNDFHAQSGCAAGSLPFPYLGVTMGANMACKSNWDIAWRFYNKKEALWCRVIKAIHGENGGISNRDDQRKKSGTWYCIIGLVNYLHDKQIIDYNTIKYKLVSGDKIRFWLDTWIDDQPLCVRFNRLFRLESDSNCKVCERWGDVGWIWNWRRGVRGGIEQEQLENMLAILTCIQLQEGNDKLCWSLDGETEFSVAGTRRRIDAFLHTGSNIGSIWCNSVPKKVNVFAWRVLLDRLPTRYNLSRIGLESILCPTCGAGMESMSHTLFTCCLAKEVWTHIYRWFYPCLMVSHFLSGGNGVICFQPEIKDAGNWSSYMLDDLAV
ncbi:RNA-directed DNA polymerase, eukaryota [Tanacetum coccineum]